MTAVELPGTIEEKLGELAIEFRRLRVLRGMGALALILFVTPMIAILLDATWDLPAWSRVGWLATWGLLGAGASWWFVVRRWRQEIPLLQLAQAIEAEYPSLAERLRTLVELSEHADASNGSAAMLEILARETELRARRLNFFQAAPRRFSFRFGIMSGLIALLSLTPLLLVNDVGDRCRRLIFPWFSTSAEPAFRVVISSGDLVVKRGDPITLSAYLERTRPTGELPTAATLVYRNAKNSAEITLPMNGEAQTAFVLTRPRIDADFDYCVEVQGQRSPWHSITVVDPVQLAAGTRIQIVAPPYATAQIPERTREGFGEIEALQYSLASMTLRFDRVPTDVHLEWRPTSPNGEHPIETIPLHFSDDRLSATVTTRLKGDGSFKLVLFGAKAIRTELPVVVRTIPDTPPRFDRVLGMPESARDVKPDAVLPIELLVLDDVAVQTAVVEFAPLDSDDPKLIRREPLNLLGLGTGKAEGRVSISLAGKARVGESFRMRIRVTDNRHHPEFQLTPHEVTYPPKDWAVLRSTPDARPFTEQDILAKKTKIAGQLEAIQQQLAEAAKEVAAVKKEAEGKPRLFTEQTVRLNEAQDTTRQTAEALERLAEELRVSPELRPLAQSARQIAEQPLPQARDQIQKATSTLKVEDRDPALGLAQRSLQEALRQIEELQKKNAEAAQVRLDRDRLQRLTEEQEQLAREALQPDSRPADLTVRQRELNQKLSELLRESEALKAAEKAASAGLVNQMAKELNEIAEQQLKLNAGTPPQPSPAQERIDELAKKQKDLNQEIAKLTRKTEAAARVAETSPLDRNSFERTETLLDEKKPVEALAEQEKAARELERLAQNLEQAAAKRSDAKEAAKQIARWQQDLRQRTADAAKQNPTGVPNELRARLAAEQQAIRNAVEKLPLPATDELQKLRREASQQTEAARDPLRRDPITAEDSLKKATEALDQLAQRTPTTPQRLRAAREELEKLQRQQETISREATEAVRTADKTPADELQKKLKSTAEKQDELAKKVKSLDLPAQETRGERAADATDQAAEDLRSGRTQDVPASQQDARRQLERLKERLDGQIPADEKVEELARLQKQLSSELTKMKSVNPEDLQRLQRVQREIQQQLNKLAAQEAGQLLPEARQASQAAEAALRKPEPDVDELRKKSKAAEESLDQLARRLSGQETDEQRLDRLTRQRAEQLEKAQAKPNPTPNPAAAGEAQRAAERDLEELNATRVGQAQEAKAKAKEALNELKKASDADRNPKLQKAAADAMKALADQVKQNADRTAKLRNLAETQRDPVDPSDPANALPTAEDAQRARDLARDQRRVRDELSQAAEAGAKAAATAKADAATAQRQQQEALAKRTQELAQKLDKAAQMQPKGERALDEAARATKEAAAKMEQSNRETQAGRSQQAQTARSQASEQLAEAMKKASGTMPPSPMVSVPPSSGDGVAQAAQEARKASDEMKQAEARLQQGGTGKDAQPAMKQAADSLKRASEQMARGAGNSPPGTPASINPGGPEGQSAPSREAVPSVIAEHLGKPWGELPGEVKSRITAELAAKYGEDFARVIKLYFEQQAERK